MRPALPLLLAALAVPLAAVASAQTGAGPDPLGSRPRVYVGAGFGPGFGAVGGATASRVTGGSGRLVTAVGVGGGVRVLRALDVVRNRDAGPLDVDLGVRVGPSFYTAFFEPSAESRSRAFSVMIDPFARVTLRRPSGRVLFAEAGTQGPAFRAGLSTSLRLGGP